MAFARCPARSSGLTRETAPTLPIFPFLLSGHRRLSSVRVHQKEHRPHSQHERHQDTEAKPRAFKGGHIHSGQDQVQRPGVSKSQNAHGTTSLASLLVAHEVPASAALLAGCTGASGCLPGAVPRRLPAAAALSSPFPSRRTGSPISGCPATSSTAPQSCSRCPREKPPRLPAHAGISSSNTSVQLSPIGQDAPGRTRQSQPL